MGLVTELYDGGQTIRLVTRADEIAAHARRLIHLGDGKIEPDTSR